MVFLCGRCGLLWWNFLGADQVGGLLDSRFPVILHQEEDAKRNALGLPVLDFLGDVRFGYDGGRHARVLIQLNYAGTPPREWLMIRSLLAGTVFASG